MKTIRWIILLVFALASCAPIQPQTTDFPSPPATLANLATETQAPPFLPTQGVETPMPSIIPELSPALQKLAENARQDLANRLSVPAADITILQAAPVTWSDSSLGCPQPGMAYAQMLTPGFLVVLSHAGTQVEYHAGRSQALVFCKNPQKPSSFSPGDI